MTTPTLRPLDAEATVKTLNQEAARFQALAAAQLALADAAQRTKLGDVAATALTLKRVYEEAAERLYGIVDTIIASRPGAVVSVVAPASAASASTTPAASTATATAPASALTYFKQCSPAAHTLAQRVLSGQLKPAQRYVALAQLLDSTDVATTLPSPVVAELRTAYLLITKELPQLDDARSTLVELQHRWISTRQDGHAADLTRLAKAITHLAAAQHALDSGDVATYRAYVNHAVADLQIASWPGGDIQAMGQATITELQRLRNDAAIRQRLNST